MCDDGCGRCAALEAENAALRARISKLEHENAMLRAYIVYLVAIIDKAARFVAWVIREADTVLSGHHPRGTWSIWRGRREVAARVQGILARR